MMASLARDLIWMRSVFVTLVPVGRETVLPSWLDSELWDDTGAMPVVAST